MVHRLSEPVSGDGPDLGPVREVVSDRIWRALVDSSATLTKIGVRHALIGGLAVGAHGYARATKDVNFIVDDSGWTETPEGLVVMRVAMPIRAHGVDINTLVIPIGETHLASAITDAVVTEGIPVAPAREVAYLKLLSPRRHDHADVAELLERGALDEHTFEAYLNRVDAPTVVRDRWDAVADDHDHEA